MPVAVMNVIAERIITELNMVVKRAGKRLK